MFRITEDPSSGSLIQCLVKNYKNDSIVSVDMDNAQRVRLCCHNTDYVHVNGHDRTILVIFSQALYKAPWWWILCDPKHVRVLLNIL